VRTRVANILKLQAATRLLERLASTDPLTGAYNRRHFIDVGNNELLRSHRYNHALTAMMIDIDHFKVVNDTYGHGIGDQALKETVRVIGATLRGEDTLGRLGGEEFAVLLPVTDATQAALPAERIRDAISQIVIKTPDAELTFTMSIGLTQGREGDKLVDTLLGRADEGLYQAKEKGRNRVVVV
jgi:diguanylate cyclase (GGDEF)-like protein